MLFAIVLGTMLGAAGITLLGQFVEGATSREVPTAAITPTAFPRLAPSERVPRYTPRLWHRAA